jgi:hypothetical protein
LDLKEVQVHAPSYQAI